MRRKELVMPFEEGLYEKLILASEGQELEGLDAGRSQVKDLEEKKLWVSRTFESSISQLIKAVGTEEELEVIISQLEHVTGEQLARTQEGHLESLLWVSKNQALDSARWGDRRPLTSISDLALFTNSRDEPRVDLELERELATADRVEILVSFIKVSGLRLLESQLLKLRDRGIPVRLITTTYMGATDKKAIDRLVNELGVDVRIDLSPATNRLHAKAWLFHRKTGFSTAYIGSSNMSHAALTTGSEWNVRLAQVKAPELFSRFQAAFETYWEAETYTSYSTLDHGEALEEALSRQSNQGLAASYLLPSLEVTPRPHQVKMLEELDVSRNVLGFSSNLVVAATGTGKTVLAALDYSRLIELGKPRPTLLFVAHRQEILKQALATFRQVLKDGDFGELLVDGHRPKEWRFVFATVQSLAGSSIASLPSDHFQHLIVDEFHHAEARSYKFLFESLKPRQIVGLTATPERADGLDSIWRQVFGGRIASELRLWDALSQDLLSPFHYFGIGEELDYGQLPWAGGRYEVKALSNLLTSNSFRNRRVLAELDKRIPDLSSMKAIIFCVSVEHARQVAHDFSAAGVRTEVVTGETNNRSRIIQELRLGAIQAIVTVDVFNEGVDIPEVDTIVLLRPTESPVVFLQQIGRGLRRSAGKGHVLILDFIGAHRAEYRVDRKFSALVGRPRAEIINHFEQGFPYLPSGSAIQLDALSQSHILDILRRQISPKWAGIVEEVRQTAKQHLVDYLSETARDLWDIYRNVGRTWTLALSEAGLRETAVTTEEKSILERVTRFIHLDDDVRLGGYLALLSSEGPQWRQMTELQKKLAKMLFWNLFEDGRKPWDSSEWNSIDEALIFLRGTDAFRFELANLFSVLRNQIKIVGRPFELSCGPHPFLAHATYSRNELLGGLGYARIPGDSNSGEIQKRSVKGAVAGVYFIPESNLDLFFVNLTKGDKVSESLKYEDYAVSPTIFHWDSQASTSVESETGRRYISQRGSGRDVILAVREKPNGPYGTNHFKLMGPVDYLRHSGSKPISFWWKLRIPMDPESFEIAAAAKAV